MIVTGIVVEYNPLHNGHIKHIKLAREKTNCDVLIAVMSGDFVQRGHPAIVDKYERVKAALLNEVDLIIEIPFVLVNQNASVFASSAIKLLELAKCDYVVFGSEINDIEVLKTFSEVNINVDNLKEVMQDGTSYPKAYGLLSKEFYPNDILAIAYLKALKNTNIKPLIIKRDNFFDNKLEIKSATHIRQLIYENLDYKKYTPMHIEKSVFIEDYFTLIKTILLTKNSNNLKQLALFAEGIENNLKKVASVTYNYNDFINQSISRRYTKARINRTLMFMLLDITQKEIDNLDDLSELKVLGFNESGQKYIRYLLDSKVKVITKFKYLNKTYRDFEMKACALYISTLSKDKQEYLWERQFKGPIIYKNNKFYNI